MASFITSTVLFQFQIKDDIKAARKKATEALTRPSATLSQKERVNRVLSPFGRVDREGTLRSLRRANEESALSWNYCRGCSLGSHEFTGFDTTTAGPDVFVPAAVVLEKLACCPACPSVGEERLCDDGVK
jgi:hypothetical protein